MQQNSFHEVDGVTHPDRLRLMFDTVREIIDGPVVIKGKEEIRSHFNFIRQAFLDWNYMRPDDERFEKQKIKLLNLVKQNEHAPENI